MKQRVKGKLGSRINRKDDRISSESNSWFIIVISGLLWLDGLLYGAGIGKVYNLYGKTILLAVICYFYQFLVQKRFWDIKRETFIFVMLLFIENLYTRYKFNNNYMEYVAMYLIPILYSLMKINQRQMRIISLIYGIGGGMILGVANYTNYFAGWDGNSVSLVCFFSYAVFIAGFVEISDRKVLIRVVAYSIIYFIWLEVLNSRGSMLFSAIMLLCVLKVIPMQKIINKKSILIILLVPLFIAILVVLVNQLPFIQSLNKWSLRQFKKTLFNGRDTLWEYGINIWKENWLFGIGTFNMNWHNSAVACLAGAGSLGYFIWIYGIRKIWVDAYNKIDDGVVYGLLLSFMIIWMQQSIEQGLVVKQGNPIIFTLLGLLMARINTLKRESY